MDVVVLADFNIFNILSGLMVLKAGYGPILAVNEILTSSASIVSGILISNAAFRNHGMSVCPSERYSN